MVLFSLAVILPNLKLELNSLPSLQNELVCQKYEIQIVAKNLRRIFSASFWAACRHNFKYENLTLLFGGLL